MVVTRNAVRSATASFFFNDTATTEIYTLSLHDALPISLGDGLAALDGRHGRPPARREVGHRSPARSEEHTSELQSRQYLVCRLLLEKKKLLDCVLEWGHVTIGAQADVLHVLLKQRLDTV